MNNEALALCRPCACALEAEGDKLCRPLKRGIDQKVTCQRCGRRRYGMIYQIEQKNKEDRI